jgi:hypothetical protein
MRSITILGKINEALFLIPHLFYDIIISLISTYPNTILAFEKR